MGIKEDADGQRLVRNFAVILITRETTECSKHSRDISECYLKRVAQTALFSEWTMKLENIISIFTYLYYFLKILLERQISSRQEETEIFYPLVHAPSACNGLSQESCIISPYLSFLKRQS